MEDLKRANQIWTNDSLFLREYLLVPFIRKPVESSISLINGTAPRPPTSNDESMEIISKRELESSLKEKKKSEEQTAESAKISQGQSAKDFLSKFDTSLTQIKTNVQKLEEKTQ